jgi:multidrug transporter EmrE-like cation transporter
MTGAFFRSTDTYSTGKPDILWEFRLSSAVSNPATLAAPPAARHPRAVLLVFCCTILGAAAQLLMKMGAHGIVQHGIVGILTNVPLIAGYTLYGLSTVLLVLALKDGELSILYPVIALTYVWVTVLSFVVFHDTVNPYKLAGITVIVIGVAVLGSGGRK